MKSALLIVDVQNDFCLGGALAVPDGDRVVEPLNKMIERAQNEGWPIIASRDWHPSGSRHFAEFGGKWPVHCIKETSGAAFHPGLKLPKSAVIISKGLILDGPDCLVDGYSAFDGIIELDSVPESVRAAILFEFLVEQKVKMLLVGGLATDYCVKKTVLDALNLGFAVHVLSHACCGVNLEADDSRRAFREMLDGGAVISFEPYEFMLIRKGKLKGA